MCGSLHTYIYIYILVYINTTFWDASGKSRRPTPRGKRRGEFGWKNKNNFSCILYDFLSFSRSLYLSLYVYSVYVIVIVLENFFVFNDYRTIKRNFDKTRVLWNVFVIIETMQAYRQQRQEMYFFLIDM